MKKTDKDTTKAAGGIARAKSLTPEQRSSIAAKGAAARWGEKLIQATHKGNFVENFGVDVECYVLGDSVKTAVLTQRGIATALGLSNPGGKDFERLVGRKWLSKHLGAEVIEKISQPIEFVWVYPGAKQSTKSIKGYSADILIDVCNAILSAEAANEVAGSQENLARQSRVILNASAKSGITNLVYALSGFQPETEAVIQAFRAFVQEEAKKYEKEFPNELYAEWARLYSIQPPVRGRSWKHKHLTVDHVYTPLAKSDGKLLKLLREAKSADGGDKKLFQFLNEVGARALRMHLGRILEMAESSDDALAYEAKIVDRFGGQKGLNFSSK